jgi:hypothetical protein
MLAKEDKGFPIRIYINDKLILDVETQKELDIVLATLCTALEITPNLHNQWTIRKD